MAHWPGGDQSQVTSLFRSRSLSCPEGGRGRSRRRAASTPTPTPPHASAQSDRGKLAAETTWGHLLMPHGRRPGPAPLRVRFCAQESGPPPACVPQCARRQVPRPMPCAVTGASVPHPSVRACARGAPQRPVGFTCLQRKEGGPKPVKAHDAKEAVVKPAPRARPGSLQEARVAWASVSERFCTTQAAQCGGCSKSSLVLPVPRDVLEGGGGSEGGEGGGFRWDPPTPRVPLWSPLRAGQKLLSLNPLGAKGAEANFWLSASNIGKGGGGGCLKGWGGLGGGGPLPSSYGVRPFQNITACPPLPRRDLPSRPSWSLGMHPCVTRSR